LGDIVVGDIDQLQCHK